MARGIPVVIVEGHLEHIFIKENCGTKIQVLKLSNGDSVSPEALAKQVYYQLNALSVQPSHVVILADRESRQESSIDIENAVTNALNQNFNINIPFSVHVPDKMIENWIIADTAVLQKEGLTIDLPNGPEGCGGKSKLKEAYKTIGIKYIETEHGPRLLKKCAPSSIKILSPSFNRFHSAALLAIPNCHWLKK